MYTILVSVSDVFQLLRVVKRTLLKNILRLCVFLGWDRTADMLLPVSICGYNVKIAVSHTTIRSDGEYVWFKQSNYRIERCYTNFCSHCLNCLIYDFVSQYLSPIVPKAANREGWSC